jgi:hypothetical protein
MNDTELDVLVAGISPISDRQVAALPLDRAEAELLEAILALPLAGPVVGDRTHAGPTTAVVPLSGRRRHRTRRRLTVVATAAALVVGAVLWQQSRPDEDGETVVAVEQEAADTTTPRLLVDRPGWSVQRAAPGTMTFSDGTTTLRVSWSAGNARQDHEGAVASMTEQVERIQALRVTEGSPTERASIIEPLVIMGQEAFATRLMSPDATDPDDVMFEAAWVLDDFAVDASATIASQEAFVDLVTSLHQVDMDTWLGAMPDDVIQPDGQRQAVDELLADVPLPPGIDLTAFRTDNAGIESRTDVAIELTNAVACGWFDSWVAATDAGDRAGAERAVEAMATSRSWPVVVEGGVDGQFGMLPIWELADAMPTNAVTQYSNGQVGTPRDLYVDRFACDL